MYELILNELRQPNGITNNEKSYDVIRFYSIKKLLLNFVKIKSIGKLRTE